MSTYLDQLCAYICRCDFSDLPSDIVVRAKEVVADTFAVIAAGAQEEEVKALTAELTNARANGGGASVIGRGIRTEALKAALVNGTAGTFLELDEGNQFGRGHAGIQVIPAVFAMAEERGLAGRDVITALVLGYEVAIRIGIACKLRMSMHPHGTWGTVGAAVAAAKLMGYNEGEMKEIISVSASMTTATNRRTMLEGGTVRNVYSGLSSHNGLLAHYMVKAGFTGENDGLKTVFGSVVSDSFVPGEMVAGLGQRFEIGRNYFKKHACCRYNHSALDATEEILAKTATGRLRSDEIAAVEVQTYSLAAQLCSQQPRNTLAAKFSIPFAVATRIVNGHAGVSSFMPPAVGDGEIRALAKKVTVTEAPELTAMMPARRPSRVRLTLNSGEVLRAEAVVNKGDAEDPYSAQDLRAKFFELLEPVWGSALAQKLHAHIMTLETCPDFNQITSLVSPDR